jgi:hypothetical protein
MKTLRFEVTVTFDSEELPFTNNEIDEIAHNIHFGIVDELYTFNDVQIQNGIIRQRDEVGLTPDDINDNPIAISINVQPFADDKK